MDWGEIVAGNIRRWRLARELPQEEVAHRARITVSYYGQVERGRRNVSVSVLGRIADALEVPLVRLFDQP